MKSKNMSKKFKIIIPLCIILLFIIFISIFGFKFNNKNVLNLEENKWIDENKYNVIDIAILNEIPVLSYEGEGLIYDYLEYITQKYSLKFNILSYKLDDEIEYDYKLNIVDAVSENDVEILEDNFVLITKNNVQYNDIKEINNLKIGVLSSDSQRIKDYINNPNIQYIEYSTYSELKNSIVNSEPLIGQENTSNVVDAIIALKTVNMKEIIESKLNIAYHFNDLNKFFVLSTNGNENLNNIFQKTYDDWKFDNFDTKYKEFLLNEYYKFNKLSDVEQKTMKSKSYVYGFVNYGIYNYLNSNKITGINALILKDFNVFSGLSITYTQYNSISKMISDFNKHKLDFIFDVVPKEQLKNDIFITSDVMKKDLVIVSDINNNIPIDNIKSLKNIEVLTLKDSYIESYLKENKIKYKSYNNLQALVDEFGVKDVMLMDIENYNFYKSKDLKNTRINYNLEIDDNYNFIIDDKESNKLFEDLFNFYLSFNSINKLVTVNYENITNHSIDIMYILIVIIIILVMYIILDFYNHIKTMLKTIKQSKKINLTKEEKILYIDQLTSLKNRAYLNSRIEAWDESEIYPQCIVVIDLNNISYINDNYGREEGDKVITEAANILIQNQLANSEIIRTDGNEFLIYLVGYTEKQIISYLSKISKEFKNLSHGFGAASGYSIITDAIKTLDDAVNEATIAMKENKEDIDY